MVYIVPVAPNVNEGLGKKDDKSFLSQNLVPSRNEVHRTKKI